MPVQTGSTMPWACPEGHRRPGNSWGAVLLIRDGNQALPCLLRGPLVSTRRPRGTAADGSAGP